MGKIFPLLLSTSMLCSCNNGIDNQIDKCVNSLVKAGEPYKNNDEKEYQEASSRLECLKAASGRS